MAEPSAVDCSWTGLSPNKVMILGMTLIHGIINYGLWYLSSKLRETVDYTAVDSTARGGITV